MTFVRNRGDMADGQDKGKLTPKQQAFVDAYVGEAKGNATKAALDAGYSPKTAYSIAHENLKKPEIAQAISDRTSEFAMSPEEILANLADVGRNSSIVPLIDAHAYGKPTFNLVGADGQLKPETRFIKSMTVTDDSVKVELHDKIAALVQLGKYHKLWTERTETSGTLEITGGVTLYIPDNGRDNPKE